MADDVRTTQIAPEAIIEALDGPARTTQIAPEIIGEALAGPCRVTQIAVEIIREFRCEGGPVTPEPIGTVQLAQIRRLLQTPPMAQEQNWLFFSKFSLDVETGVKDPSKS